MLLGIWHVLWTQIHVTLVTSKGKLDLILVFRTVKQSSVLLFWQLMAMREILMRV